MISLLAAAQKAGPQPNGFVMTGAVPRESEVIQKLVAAVTTPSSAEPEEQNNVAKAGIRLQHLGPLVHQAQQVCCCAGS